MATFTHETPYGNAPSIKYNSAAATYSSTVYTYKGQLVTVWTHESQH